MRRVAAKFVPASADVSLLIRECLTKHGTIVAPPPSVLLSRFDAIGLFIVPEVEIVTKKVADFRR